jgi:hypothetical protein
MTTGPDQLTRLQYELKIEAVQDTRKLILMALMEIYDMKVNCAKICETPISDRTQKAFNVAGLSALIIALISGIVDYFRRRP